MPHKIYITRKLPEAIKIRLAEHFEVRSWEKEDEPVPRETLLEEIKDVDGLFCMITEKIDEEVLQAGKDLKVVANMAVGYNNIDVETATANGITVTNTPDVLTETTADLAFALLMASARRLVETSDTVRNGEWGAWSPMQFTGQDVFGATLGIVGLGRIGEAVVNRAKGFNMDVLYYSRTRKKDKESDLDIEYAELDVLLKKADFVVLLLPYSSESHHLIGRRELALMKENAILINASRGGIVDEDALYQALVSGEIWGAGLDVYEQEPVSTDHPLLTLSNVTAVPHIGSASVKTRRAMADLAADNLIHVLNGKKATTPVNLQN
ncbi:2-hydroxyacid dehydrogenase [Salicibibacter kimchii]|uniref:D-glycerate dehydrogenase n=1 Tax=Salicibibacter kimchii TaxID=2099786 RepID=A0A345C1I0_9BACI|nr:D-glycerate dehydrogenase [Salicibibacter kimchii]AXF57061.1 D-glycerate dehydrogenase [Salicibibacter kimchii]